MSGGEESRGGVRNPLLGPNVYGAAVLVMNLAFAVAGIGALYLLGAMFFGHLDQFNQAPQADRARILGNIKLAGDGLTYGLAVGAVCAAYVFLAEEMAGYAILAAAALIGLGIPFGLTSFGGETLAPEKSPALGQAFLAFTKAAYIPAGVAGLLIVKDIFQRLVGAVRGGPGKEQKMAFGAGAQKESRPVRLSVLGKCWEGPYCREFIRVHCPVFQARAACWRQKRGCYCEEDIVSAAAGKVSGTQLAMAPDVRYNFANAAVPAAAAGPRKIQLSDSQKRERCRNCIIYNEHQKDKYRLLMPVVLVGTIMLCVLFAGALKGYLGVALTATETLMARFSFLPGKGPQIGKPSETVQWVLISALVIMAISKVLQALEWAIFKVKI